jgi:antirestriction protein ArdC
MKRYRRSNPPAGTTPAGVPSPARDDAPTLRWAGLLADAVQQPGTIARCYSAFWSYSLGNQLAALMQCQLRRLEPGPIATFPTWQALGRQVRKGERAIWLCQPITCTRQSDDSDDGENDVYTRFTWRPRWFVLSQTDTIPGREYTPPELPGWDPARALEALDVREEPFTHLNGNTQGYSKPGRVLAINPVAAHPERTTFHELGHIVAGHFDVSATLEGPTMEVEAEAVAYLCADALGLGGADEARGYIQHYLRRGGRLDEPVCRRIFKAADAILQAGRPVEAGALALAA